MRTELDGLAFPNTKIIVSLRLHQCPTITAGINVHRTDSLRHYFWMGKRLGMSLSSHLMGQAPFDDDANEKTRELARSLLRSVLRLPHHPAREQTAQAVAALLLWLVLHDQTQGQLLRETMLQSLQFSRMAVVTIESVPDGTYTVSIGETSLILNGTNGIPNGNYYVLDSTNLTLPLANWTLIATNIFDAHGDFAFTNVIDPNTPQLFYRLRLP